MQNIQNLRISTVQIQRSQKSSQSVSKSAGLTLLESMIALSIFAVVIWAAMANYTSANATQAASQMATELQSLRASVKDLYSGQGNFGAADATSVDITTSLIDAKKVPSTLNYADGETLKTGTGGTVVVMGGNSDFTITYDKVPKAQCISALTGAGANGWLDMKGPTGNAAAKFTPTTAAAACSDPKENKLVFRGA